MLGDERIELPEQRVMPAERELGVAEQLKRVQPLLLQALALVPHERLGREIGERGPMPEPECLAQQPGGGVGPGGVEVLPRARDQRLEALEVELARLEDDPVARAACLDPVGAQRLAQPGDVDLERLDRRGRRFLAPQRVDEGVARDRRAGPQQQRRQQRALLRASQVDRAAVRAGLDRPQDPEFHAVFSPPDARPAKPTPSGC
jgi:hypothetical protein